MDLRPPAKTPATLVGFLPYMLHPRPNPCSPNWRTSEIFVFGCAQPGPARFMDRSIGASPCEGARLLQCSLSLSLSLSLLQLLYYLVSQATGDWIPVHNALFARLPSHSSHLFMTGCACLCSVQYGIHFVCCQCHFHFPDIDVTDLDLALDLATSALTLTMSCPMLLHTWTLASLTATSHS